MSDSRVGKTDGTALEGLVRSIEEQLLPKVFTVRGNRIERTAEGIQLAEFDIEVRGRLGSAEIAWLIECRDRPGQGPAPSAWIEQLNGRQHLHGFNKVTAVSSTGFSRGAKELASRAGIDLRSLERITADDVAGWLALKHIDWHLRHSHLEAVDLGLSPDETPARFDAVMRVLRGKDANVPILTSSMTGELVSPVAAFNAAATGASTSRDFFTDVVPDGPPKEVHICSKFSAETGYYVIHIGDGDTVRINEIRYKGKLSVTTRKVPAESFQEYRRDGSAEPIAQVAVYPVEVLGEKMTLELHRLPEKDYIQILLRKR